MTQDNLKRSQLANFTKFGAVVTLRVCDAGGTRLSRLGNEPFVRIISRKNSSRRSYACHHEALLVKRVGNGMMSKFVVPLHLFPVNDSIQTN